MVAVTLQHRTDAGGRWFVYLLLAVCVNGFMVSQVTLNTADVPKFEIPILQVNLMTLAKPTVMPKIEPVSETAAPAPIPLKSITVITQQKAAEKIVTAAMVPMPRQKPILLPLLQTKTTSQKPIVEPEKPLVIVAEQQVQKKEIAKAWPDTKKVEQTHKDEVAFSENSGMTGQDASTVVSEANYRHQTAPMYPRRALDLGQQGTVTLHAKVLPNGSPAELKVAKSSGHRLLDLAAISAVKKWKFEPSSVDGAAIVSWVRVPVNFVIQ